MSSERDLLSHPLRLANTEKTDTEKFLSYCSTAAFSPAVEQGKRSSFLSHMKLRLFAPTETHNRFSLLHSIKHKAAPSPYMPTAYIRPRTSLDSTHTPTSTYTTIHRSSNPISSSAQSSVISLPQLPHLPSITSVWPPTFPTLLDATENQPANSSRTSLHLNSVVIRDISPVRLLSPHVAIRPSSKQSSISEISPDVRVSPAMVETLETSFHHLFHCGILDLTIRPKLFRAIITLFTWLGLPQALKELAVLWILPKYTLGNVVSRCIFQRMIYTLPGMKT